jgi:thioredoxin reductase
MNEHYDVVVVGGGAAGLSAAVALGRFRRSVLVVDAGAPRNAPAEAVHNFLTRDGTPPADLLAAGRDEVTRYGGEVVTGTVTSAKSLDGAGFRVSVDGRPDVTARRLLVTTGLVDELPDVPGLAERWVRDVLHCPYCHGWEVRDQAIGVLASTPLAVHHALLFRQLSDDVMLFRHTAPDPSEEQWDRLAALGIAVVDGEVDGLEVTDDRLTGVRLRSGTVIPRRALAVQPRFTARADLLVALGLETAEKVLDGHVIATHIPAEPTGATAVPGVWVAGNVTEPMAQLISSAASGLTTAAALNGDLIEEDARSAVRDR